MRKRRQEKIYLKAFSISNTEGKFSSDEYTSFIEKFEIIRKLYYDENSNHDCYDSFRTITKELKRAAHNAGLKLEVLDLDYKSNGKYITIENNSDPCIINLLVTIKSGAKYGKENSFVVTNIIRNKKPFLIISGMSAKIKINDYMRDEEDITYLSIDGGFYGIKYFHRCINN